jgi:hypothetical protein
MRFDQAAIRFRTDEPDYSDLPDTLIEWDKSVYSGATEQLPHDFPTSLGKPVVLTHYVDESRC